MNGKTVGEKGNVRNESTWLGENHTLSETSMGEPTSRRGKCGFAGVQRLTEERDLLILSGSLLKVGSQVNLYGGRTRGGFHKERR